jgi:hypothetical protein
MSSFSGFTEINRNRKRLDPPFPNGQQNLLPGDNRTNGTPGCRRLSPVTHTYAMHESS